jgi:GntR family transcriptional repressor for pyruvate dehydrogenase complex
MNTTQRKPPARARRSTVGATAAAAAADAPLFDPVEREPAYLRVSSAIESKILSRTLRDGDVLPAETDLAQQFRVHRSTVREALRQLESAGLVTRPPGAKRMIVSRPHAAKVSSGMRHALVLHDVTFVDVWEAMMVIEPEVAALAASRRTQTDLDALAQAAEAFKSWPKDDPHQRIADAQRKIIVAVKDKNADEARKWMSKHVRDFQRGYELAGISPDTPISV